LHSKSEREHQERHNLRKFIQSWFVNTLAVLVAVYVVKPGIRFSDNSLWTPFVVSLVLGILNAFIRPVMMLLALPLLIVTLGLFTLVINALLLYCVGLLLHQYFVVDSFGAAFLGALVISIVSTLLNWLTGTNKTRVRFERRPRHSKRDDDGGGPVIDV
jgi:putative membrane protein